jgi:hypothetical protein
VEEEERRAKRLGEHRDELTPVESQTGETPGDAGPTPTIATRIDTAQTKRAKSTKSQGNIPYTTEWVI